MKRQELTELMYAVLDGEASAAETSRLERLLAEDSAARSQFEELRQLFAGLAGMPRAHPPEGLLAAVMAELPSRRARRAGEHQLFTSPGVIGDIGNGRPAPRNPATIGERFDRGTTPRGFSMSKHSFSKRKIWIGSGIAVAAVAALLMTPGIDFPPSGKDTVGTIVPAQRYRAPQMTADDVKIANPSATSQGASTAVSGSATANDAVNRSIPAAFPTAIPQVLPSAAPQVLPNAAPQVLPNAAPQVLPNAAPQVLPNAAPQMLPNAAPQMLPNAAPQMLPNAAPQMLPNAAPAAFTR